jgi:Fe2+ or Zn2+ uptake regulation protein|tara:strand:+ start:76 stop:504 length:429 start_codon:yes stop_codon:yes gene_type:complete
VNTELGDLIDRCRTAGLRRTKALEVLLDTLLENERPITLAGLAESHLLSSQCDKATIYRLLHRLTDAGIVRRLGLHKRAAYFTLILPERRCDYLICTECGTISLVDAPCPVHDLQNEIRNKTGYLNLYHELEFFGTCPKCAA